MPARFRAHRTAGLTASFAGMRGIAEWTAAFRKVKTIWAYGESAPGSSKGATKHMQMWDRATRGHRRRIDRAVAKDAQKGENVVVWSQLYGLEAGIVEPIATSASGSTPRRGRSSSEAK